MHHVKDVMLEPNPKMEFGESIQKTKALSKCRDGRCSKSECCLINTNLVLDPKQALEHSTPPMFLQISLASFMSDALGYTSLLETLASYIFLIQTNIS